MALVPTLTQYLIEQLSKHPNQRDLVLIMSDLAAIGKYISRETNRAGIAGVRGAADAINVQGEEVQKLDVFSNELCKDYLCRTGHFCAMASEEEDTVVDMRGFGEDAHYVVAFDPLDGSSNIDANVSIGTIFSVHRKRGDVAPASAEQFFQNGLSQVLAGYVLYGSSTVLVFSFGDGVHEFTLDQGLGEFLLSNERIMIPNTCSYYSTNEGNTSYISEKDRRFIEYLKMEQKISARYIGSLVADFHRNLVKGGIFLYPGVDKSDTGDYKGKLRLNYEAKPLAFLAQQAGGRATDGMQDILDIMPSSLHQRTPLIIGNKDIVDEYILANKS
ncbi:class 1 fructose-bisphosphatase [Candidatus Uhrbacteria bacterium]|nr:class 1 fructose-bisphosphatase [Candidatus Uhrbacteria bacterium]